MCQPALTLVLDESKKHDVSVRMEKRQRADFGKKAWVQSDRSSNAWVMACPKEHNKSNARQFSVVA